jgi:hypothetical protein
MKEGPTEGNERGDSETDRQREREENKTAKRSRVDDRHCLEGR